MLRFHRLPYAIVFLLLPPVLFCGQSCPPPETACVSENDVPGQPVDPSAPLPEHYAGFRASRYGIKPFPAPWYWAAVGGVMAEKFEGAAPGGVWIVGVAGDDDVCYLNFPSDGGNYPDISFSSEDQNSVYLDYFDEHGIRVWLEVEPANADVETLIKLMLDRYGHHPSVVGVGVDVEWYQYHRYPNGKAVTDEEAAAWTTSATAYDSRYSVFLKHWLTEKMPPNARDHLLFVDDSQGFSSLEGMVAEFQVWADAFAPSPVGFQVGYSSDQAWWSRYDDPATAIGEALFAFENTSALFWVDFTVEDVFPPCE